MIMLMQLRRLLLPTMGSKAPDGPCLLDLLVGIPVLQQPLLVLVLDTLISCCTRVSAKGFIASSGKHLQAAIG